MAYNGTLIFDTKLDDVNFKAGLDKLKSLINTAGISKALGKAFDLSAAVTNATKAIDSTESLSRALEALCGDAAIAQDALAQIQAAAEGTSYSLDGAAASVQGLVVHGMTLAQATETMRAWGDAVATYSAGTDANLKTVTQALANMYSKGTVTLSDMEALMKAGIPAVDLYAAAIGKSTESVKASLQAGGVDAATFIRTMTSAIETGAGSFPSLSGAAQEAGNSWSSTFSGLGESLASGMQSIITAIDETQIALGNPTIRETISTIGDVFEHVMNDVAVAIVPVAEHLDTLVIAITSAGLAFAAGAALLKIDSIFTAVITPLATLITTIGTATTATTMFSTAVNVLFTALGKLSLGTWLGIAAAAVGVIMGLIAHFSKGSEEYQRQGAIIDKLAESQEKLLTAQQASGEAFQSNKEQIKEEAGAATELAAKIKELTDQENRSSEEKFRLAQYIKELNALQGDLNLSYDAERDKLNVNADALAGYIEAQQKMAEGNAYLERQNELKAEGLAIAQETKALEEQKSALEEQKGAMNPDEYQERLNQLLDIEQSYADRKKQIKDEAKIVQDEYDALDMERTQQQIAAIEAQKQAAEEQAAAEAAEMERRKEALASYTDVATNAFERIKTDSALSVEQMIGNLQKNQELLQGWSENIGALADRGINEGLLQKLRDAGPEMAGTVANLVNASDDQIKQLNEVFANGSKEAADALCRELGLPEVTNSGSDMVDELSEGVENNPALEDATLQLISDTKTAAETQVKNSNFSTVGEQISAGVATGITNGTSTVTNAVNAVVKAALTAAETSAKIESPSKLFRDKIGLNIAQGWALGIEKGQPLVTDSIEGTVTAARDAALWNVPSLRLSQFAASMQAAVAGGVGLRAFGLAGAGFGAPALAAAAAGGGGSTVNYYSANIDAKNVREWNDVVKVFQNHRTTVRKGYAKG